MAKRTGSNGQPHVKQSQSLSPHPMTSQNREIVYTGVASRSNTNNNYGNKMFTFFIDARCNHPNRFDLELGSEFSEKLFCAASSEPRPQIRMNTNSSIHR